MKDRIASHPGRVKLTLVSGNIYDMEMADDPVEVGTALNKANLLTDATASAIGARFGSSPDTPDDALNLLLGCLATESVTWVGNNTYGVGNETEMAFTHEPKLVYISQRNGGNVNFVVSTSLLDWNALKDADAEAGTPTIAVTYNGTAYPCNYSITGNTLKLWHSTNATVQYNANNFVYYALAIY